MVITQNQLFAKKEGKTVLDVRLKTYVFAKK